MASALNPGGICPDYLARPFAFRLAACETFSSRQLLKHNFDRCTMTNKKIKRKRKGKVKEKENTLTVFKFFRDA